MSEELKACPKCGIVGKVVSDDPDCGYRKAYIVECDCGEWFDTEAEAIAAWNRRTPDWQHDEAWHKDYEGRLLADAQRTSEELIEMRALAQQAGKALGVTLSLLCGFLECPDWEAGTKCEHDFRPTCPKIPQYITRPYDELRKAGLEV